MSREAWGLLVLGGYGCKLTLSGALLVEGLRAAFGGSPVWEMGVWFRWFYIDIDVVVVEFIILLLLL